MSKENIVKTKAINLLATLNQLEYSNESSLEMFLEAREIIDNIEKNKIEENDLDDWSDRLEDLQSDLSDMIDKEQERIAQRSPEFERFSFDNPKL